MMQSENIQGTWSSNLLRIDYFGRKRIDETTRTLLGVILTCFIPVMLIAYATYVYIQLEAKPPTQDVQTHLSWNTVFTLNFRCNAPNGCFMTNAYEGGDSRLCKAQLVAAYPTASFSQCSFIPYNSVVEVPFCYTSDPIDGPKFMWERFVGCQADSNGAINSTYSRTNLKSTNAGNLPPAPNSNRTYATSGPECRNGVSLLNYFINPSNGTLVGPMVLSLFYGIHVLQLSVVSAELGLVSSPSVSSIQAPPVQVTTQSFIDSSNQCCTRLGLNCYKQGDPGQANDHYAVGPLLSLITVAGTHAMVAIHIQPTYDEVTLTLSPIWYQVMNSMGSCWNIVIFIFGFTINVFRLSLYRSGNGGVAVPEVPKQFNEM